jgi:hypothetical protein
MSSAKTGIAGAAVIIIETIIHPNTFFMGISLFLIYMLL